MKHQMTDFDFRKLLPDSIASDAVMDGAGQSINTWLAKTQALLDQVLIYDRLDLLSDDVLNLLAWQYSVDFYSIDLPAEQKRNMIRNSIAWHKKKGTRWAVEQALAKYGYDARVVSFRDLVEGRAAGSGLFSPDREVVSGLKHWAEFALVMPVESIPGNGGWVEQVRHVVDIAKPVRSHLSGIFAGDQTELVDPVFAHALFSLIHQVQMDAFLQEDTVPWNIRPLTTAGGRTAQKSILPVVFALPGEIFLEEFMANTGQASLPDACVSIAQAKIPDGAQIEEGRITADLWLAPGKRYSAWGGRNCQEGVAGKPVGYLHPMGVNMAMGGSNIMLPGQRCPVVSIVRYATGHGGLVEPGRITVEGELSRALAFPSLGRMELSRQEEEIACRETGRLARKTVSVSSRGRTCQQTIPDVLAGSVPGRVFGAWMSNHGVFLPEQPVIHAASRKVMPGPFVVPGMGIQEDSAQMPERTGFVMISGIPEPEMKGSAGPAKVQERKWAASSWIGQEACHGPGVCATPVGFGTGAGGQVTSVSLSAEAAACRAGARRRIFSAAYGNIRMITFEQEEL